MEFTFMNMLLVFVAGIASIASPCVLPVVPIIVTGTAEDYKHRPLLIVIGLSVTFMLMGVVSSLFGGVIGSKMIYIEKIAGGFVALLGILMLLNVNFFKYLSFFQNIKAPTKNRGKWSGLLLGMTLGLIWIPCIGPMLSGVLAKVALDGELLSGVFLLAIYSVGFAIPMLIAGYSTQVFRTRIVALQKKPWLIRWLSGSILLIFGLYIMLAGTMM